MSILKTIEDFKNYLFDMLCVYNGRDLRLMIPGGSVLECLEDSRYSELDTTKWKIFFCDERVDRQHSNFKAASRFLDRIQGEVFPIEIDRYPEESAKIYENVLKKITGNNTMIDLCLLGVGENGHICSIWPHSEVLKSERLVECVKVDCSLSPERITVTPKFINEHIQRLYFVIPPKNGKPKKVSAPDESILKRLEIEYQVLHSE